MTHQPTKAKLFFVLLALLAFPAFAQNKYAAQLAELDAYVEKARQDWKIPGLAMAIVKDDQVIFAKGFGVRELGKPEPVNEKTLFAIASNTKAFTTALLATLVDDGKLTWDDYLQLGVVEPLRVVKEISGEDKINVFGFCVGGTILATALAALHFIWLVKAWPFEPLAYGAGVLALLGWRLRSRMGRGARARA